LNTKHRPEEGGGGGGCCSRRGRGEEGGDFTVPMFFRRRSEIPVSSRRGRKFASVNFDTVVGESRLGGKSRKKTGEGGKYDKEPKGEKRQRRHRKGGEVRMFQGTSKCPH